jgi:hypothetical protein
VQWLKQFGRGGNEQGNGVWADSDDNALITGVTLGGLVGPAVPGTGSAVFLLKLAGDDGSEIFTEEFGTDEDEDGMGITVDTSDNPLIAGRTWGDLDGSGNKGLQDIFVRSTASSDGSERWTKQFGTGGVDQCYRVAVNASGLIAAACVSNGNLPGTSGGYDAVVVVGTP